MTDTPNEKREQFISDYCARSDEPREQAEAFLAILGSAMARRGIWPEAQVLNDEEKATALNAFIGSQ